MNASASLSESSVEEYISDKMHRLSLVTYSSQRLVKSYPKGLRQDSSNMNPVISWCCGIQCGIIIIIRLVNISIYV